MNVIRYPSRDEAIRYRAELQDAVDAARREEQPEKYAFGWPTTLDRELRPGLRLKNDALAWAAGLDRRLLLGLPVRGHTRRCLRRGGLECGEGAYTVEQFLRVRYLTPEVLRDLVLATDAFLAAYIATFDDVPGPADVAAMRLTRAVESLTSIEAAVVEQRLLTDPPVKYRELVLQLEMSTARIWSRLCEARRKIEVALGPELHIIAAEVKAGLEPSSSEGDVAERIDALLDAVLPDHCDGTGRRVKALFRLALVKELDLKAGKRRRAK